MRARRARIRRADCAPIGSGADAWGASGTGVVELSSVTISS
jgi:hypothetical protein